MFESNGIKNNVTLDYPRTDRVDSVVLLLLLVTITVTDQKYDQY